jgi:FkbM family methyltransferase
MSLRGALSRLNRPRVYVSRHGIGRGFRQVGGAGLLLPSWLQKRREEFPEHVIEEEAFLRGLDLSGKTVYDIGSFHGILAMFFAGQAGPEGRVVAFEPHPDSFNQINEHLRLNAIENVTVLNAGVAAHSGTIELTGEEGRASGSAEIAHSMEAGSEPLLVRTVPVHAIDDLAGSVHPDPAFVKIDVEGMELDVLKGMQATIARCKPELFVEMHGATEDAKSKNAHAVVNLLIGHGYELRHVQSGQSLAVETADRAKRGHIHAS